MILFIPLRPASLTSLFKRAQKTQNKSYRSIDRSEDVFVEYPVHVISVAVLVAVV